jgi:hypothetical protein
LKTTEITWLGAAIARVSGDDQEKS